MRNWRYATTDGDIRPELLNSEIMKGLLGKYDAYDDGGDEIVFVDPYENFFFQISDKSHNNQWNVDMGDYLNEDGEVDESYWEVAGGVEMCVLRCLYVTPHRRGQGRLGRVLKDITDLSDDTGESVGLFVDCFKISGYGRETTATQAFLKFKENGYEKTDDWLKDVYYLRKKYMSYGFQNIVYDKAQVTEGFQHFAYISKNAPEKERRTLESLKVNYGFKRFDKMPETD